MKQHRLILVIAALSTQLFAGYVVKWTAPLPHRLSNAAFGCGINSPYTCDVDGDGIPDIFLPDTALLRVYSGVTHNLIWTVTTPGYEYAGTADPWDRGQVEVSVTNTDGDSNKELVVPASRDSSTTVWSTFFVYDCRTHALEFEAPENSEADWCAVADVDGDGMSEILLPDYDAGVLRVYGWSSGGVAEEPAPGGRPSKVFARPSITNRAVTIAIPQGLKTGAGLTIVDAAGRIVKTVHLLKGEGARTIRWDCRDDLGRPVPSGKYFYRSEGVVGQVEVAK